MEEVSVMLLSCPEFCAPVYRVNLTVPLRWSTGSFSLSAAACEGLGQVPSYCMWKGVRRGCHLSVTFTTTWQTRGAQPAFPFLHPQDQLDHVPVNRFSVIVLPMWGVGPSLLSTSAGEGQDQFSLVLKQERGETNSVQPYLHSHQWYQEPWISTQIITALRPFTETWTMAGTQVQTPQVPGWQSGQLFQPALITFIPSNIPLFTGQKPFCVCVSVCM